MAFKVRKYNRGIITKGTKQMKELCFCGALDCVRCYGKSYVAMYNRLQEDNIPQCSQCPKYLDDENDIAEHYYNHMLGSDHYVCNACADKNHRALAHWLNRHSA